MTRLQRIAVWLGLVECPNEPHESGMVYDTKTDKAMCPICKARFSTDMGSM